MDHISMLRWSRSLPSPMFHEGSILHARYTVHCQQLGDIENGCLRQAVLVGTHQLSSSPHFQFVDLYTCIRHSP